MFKAVRNIWDEISGKNARERLADEMREFAEEACDREFVLALWRRSLSKLAFNDLMLESQHLRRESERARKKRDDSN
jgi:hypothetical protein